MRHSRTITRPRIAALLLCACVAEVHGAARETCVDAGIAITVAGAASANHMAGVAAHAQHEGARAYTAGHYGRAVRWWSRYLDAVRASHGPKHAETAHAMNLLATALHARGDDEAATALLADALEIERTAGVVLHDAWFASSLELALVLADEGRYAAARARLEDLVERHSDAHGAIDTRTLVAARALASVLLAQGHTDDAIARLTALRISAESAAGIDAAITLDTTRDLAIALRHAGRTQDALAALTAVAAARTRLQGERHPETLRVARDLAATRLAGGDVERGIADLERVALGYRDVLGPDHPESIASDTALAHALVVHGAPERALATLRDLEGRLHRRAQYDGARARRTSLWRTLDARDAHLGDLALTLALRAPDIAAHYAADVLVRTKYLGADIDAIVEHAARRHPNPQVAALAARVRDDRALLARAAQHVGRSNDHGELLRATQRLERDEAELARASDALARAREHAARATADAIARALPEGALLVDVRRFHDVRAHAHAEARYAAVLVDAARGVRVFDLGPVSAHADAIAAMADVERLIEDDDGANARALYTALFAAHDDVFAAATRIYLVPDGALHGVPWHALVLPDGRRWLERQPLLRLGSARELLNRAPARTAANTRDQERLLALGGVDYGSSQRPRFEPLPGTLREVEAVGALWRAQQLPAEVWSADGAAEGALRSVSRAPDYLHLATHGFFTPGPESAHAPLVASGLALAGANRDEDDGVLLAEEALDLPLDGTRLVVLSACETARGVDTAWDGSLGLVRAMRTAGARAVLSTLWQISDTYAVPFMASFYARLLADPARDPATALRATQLEWLTHEDPARRYPENWAPFVLVAPD